MRINLPWAAIATRAPGRPGRPRAIPPTTSGPGTRRSPPPGPRASSRCSRSPGAPGFAEGPGRPSSATAGSWKPDAGAYGQFARAVAIRYSGSYEGLPRVRYYQAWNEPNLSMYLAPQYKGKRSVAPEIYRRLLNSFYAGVKGVDRANVVITGGTAPYGDEPGGDRTRPLTFLPQRPLPSRARAPAQGQVPEQGQVRRPRPSPDQHQRPADPGGDRPRRRHDRGLRRVAADPAGGEAPAHARHRRAPSALGDRDLVEQQAAGPARAAAAKAGPVPRAGALSALAPGGEGRDQPPGPRPRLPARARPQVYAGLYFSDGNGPSRRCRRSGSRS